MRRFYGAICAFLGISILRKIYQEVVLMTSSETMSPLKMYALLSDYHLLVNFGLANFMLLTVLLIPRFMQWLLFGNALDQREISSIKEKFNYTLFEFVWGLVILKNIDRESLAVQTLFKYAALFACLVLTKSFHYLCDMRVATQERNITSGVFHRKSSIKLFMGINILICTDVIVFFKIRDELSQNSLAMIFGYEVLNLFPLILLTLFNYIVSVLMLARNRAQNPASLTYTVVDFTLNLVRMGLFLTYTWIFNQNFTFPVHMIPSSYKCFRLLLTKTRSLVIHKRNAIKFKKYDLLPKLTTSTASRNQTCFCLEDLTSGDDATLLFCGHSFHYECLKWWLVKSETCPICRERVHLHDTTTIGSTQQKYQSLHELTT